MVETGAGEEAVTVTVTGEKDKGMTYRGMTFPEPIIMKEEMVTISSPWPKADCVAIVSGGADSTTMLYWLTKTGRQPLVLTFDYGQKHNLEIVYAKRICTQLMVKQIVLKTPVLPGSSLTEDSIEVPKDDYSVETQKITVVPNRNMVFLAIAASYAIANGCKWVYYAAHWNDQAVYPDCTEKFVKAMNDVLQEANYEPIEVMAPFIRMTKAQIVGLGAKIGVPYEKTWSCYDPVVIRENNKTVAVHCGVCGTCRERKEAFKIVGITDPTRYHI